MSDFHKLAVLKITRETPSAVSIRFGVPADLLGAYKFTAGQYVTLKTQIAGKEVRRAYSICSPPASGNLTVLVKEVSGGVFSTYVNQKLQEGDSLEVSPPEGRFLLNPQQGSNRTYMAFAAGSGITPVISMAETALNEESDSNFILIYGNQSREETVFYERLLALKNNFPERFHLEFVFSRFAFQDFKVGRIDAALTNFYIKNKYVDYSVSDFFVCGPGAMIDVITDTLKNQGVDESNIHFERFTTAAEPETAELSASGVSTVTYIIDDETTTLEVPAKKSILEVAIANELDPPYSCQGGICSSCIARVTSGSVAMRKNQILTDSEVAEGLVLTCQSHATSATVTVDYDEV